MIRSSRSSSNVHLTRVTPVSTPTSRIFLVATDDQNIEQCFTPQRLAHIDKADADINSGKGFTTEQAEKDLALRREKWLQANPR